MPVEKDYIGGLHGYLKENFGDDFKLTTEQFKSKLSTDSAYANQLHGYLKENFGEGFKLDIADFQNKVGYIDPSKKKQNSSPNFATTLQEAITPLPSGVQKPLESSSPLASNLKSVATEKPIDAKTALLQKANQEQNLSNPLEGTTQTDVFIEENRKPTVLNMAKSINNKSQERVKVLTERVGLLKGIKDFEAQIPKIQESAQQLSDIVKDPTQPITSRQAAQEQLKLYQDQFDQFENAVNNYKGLIDKEKSIITDIHKDEDLRQKGLERDYNSITAFVDAIKSSTIKVGAGGAGMFNTLGLSGDPEDTNSENNEQVQNEVRNNVQTIKKFGESLVTQETPKNFEKIFEGDFSTKKLKYILAQGIGQTIPTVAAGFLGGAGGATIAGAGLGFIESKDMFKAAGLNEKQSDWAAFGLAIPLGALDEYGISDIITKPIGKLILKETTEDVIKTLAKKELTNEAIFETVKKTLGEKIKEYSIDVAKAGWKEPLTEMEQALLSEGAKQATEEITGKDSNANQTLSEYFKQTALKIAEEGVYGLAGGVGLSAVTSAIQNRTTPSAYQRAMELKNPELLQDFTEQLDSEVQSGRLTTEQAQIALENVKKIQELDGKIPNTIKDIDKRSMAASLVGVKDELKLEIEGKDETLVQPLKDEIKNIDQTLLDIAQNKPIEEIENGLNEQETSMSEIPTNQEQKIETPQETKTTTTPSSDNSSEVAALGSVEVPKTLSQLKISDEITQTLENKLKGLESERTNKLIENKGKGKFDDRLKDEIEEVKRNIYKRENELASRRNSDLESKIKDGSLLKLISENKITAEDARGLIIESGMEIPSEIQSIVDKNKQDKKENKQSIIERDTDFLGNEKEAYMVNNDKANGIRTQEDIDYYKANVKRAIESGKYEKSVKEGRMTANDARIIVESYGLKVPKTLETLLKTEQTNEPTPIEATIPTSNSGTQVTEPVNKESEAKVESKPNKLIPKEIDDLLESLKVVEEQISEQPIENKEQAEKPIIVEKTPTKEQNIPIKEQVQEVVIAEVNEVVKKVKEVKKKDTSLSKQSKAKNAAIAEQKSVKEAGAKLKEWKDNTIKTIEDAISILVDNEGDTFKEAYKGDPKMFQYVDFENGIELLQGKKFDFTVDGRLILKSPNGELRINLSTLQDTLKSVKQVDTNIGKEVSNANTRINKGGTTQFEWGLYEPNTKEDALDEFNSAKETLENAKKGSNKTLIELAKKAVDFYDDQYNNFEANQARYEEIRKEAEIAKAKKEKAEKVANNKVVNKLFNDNYGKLRTAYNIYDLEVFYDFLESKNLLEEKDFNKIEPTLIAEQIKQSGKTFAEHTRRTIGLLESNLKTLVDTYGNKKGDGFVQGKTVASKRAFESLRSRVYELKAEVDLLNSQEKAVKAALKEAKTESLSKEIIDKLQDLKLTYNNRLLGLVPPFNLVPAVWNTSISIIQTSVKAGKAIKDAVQDAIDYIKSQNPKNFNENEFTKFFYDKLGVAEQAEVDETEIFDKAKEAVSTTEAAIVKDPILKRINKAFLKIGTEILDNAEALMAKAKELASGGGNIQYDVIEESNLAKWIGKNKEYQGSEIQDVKTGEPVVLRVYHGTTNEFYEFDSSVKGNIEGHLGKVNYFTSDYQDASSNYLAQGADITGRVENLKERILSDLEYQVDESLEENEREDKIREVISENYPDFDSSSLDFNMELFEVADRVSSSLLLGGEEQVLDLYVKLNNPVVLGNGSTWFETLNISDSDLEQAAQEIADENDITIEEAKEDNEWEIRDRAIENTGYENLAIEALQTALSNNGYDSSKASEILGDNLYDTEIDLNKLEKDLRKAELYENNNGEIAGSQVIADFFKELGFDGIILTDVSDRFSNMGLGSNTSHIHVFDDYSNQIKLADGQNTTFGDTNDIRYQVEAWHGSPHSFDKFTTEKMGTGEGAQAFGWGLYFTDIEGIAKGYAESLAKQKQSYLYKGNVVFGDGMYKTKPNESLEYDIAAQIISDGGTVSEFSFDKAKERLKDYFKTDQNEGAISKLEDIKFSDFSQQTPNKNLYKVSLHKGKSPSEYTWLEWDKPISEKIVEKLSLPIKRKLFGFNEIELNKAIEKASIPYKVKNKQLVNRENIKDFYENLGFSGDKLNRLVANRLKSDSKYFVFVLEESMVSPSETFENKKDAQDYLDSYKLERNENLFSPNSVKSSVDIRNEVKKDFNVFDYNITGKELYKRVIERLTESDYERELEGLSKIGEPSSKQASLFLLENGIDGIKYPAESISRGATSDTARGFNYVVFDENAVTIKEAIQFQLNDKGEILGFTYNGKIYLNGEKITANTTMEEAGHIWINWAKENRSDLYQQGIEKVLGSKYLIEVNNNPNYQKEALKAGEKGSEAYNAYMQEEALSKAIADNGAKFITETRKANFREWVNTMWKEVVKAFGIQNLTPNQVKKLTLEQFAKMAAADVFKKESVMTDKEKATAKVEILDADQKMLVDDITIAENDEETIQGVKGFIDSMNRAKGLTQEEKDAMNERLGRNYEVLSNEKLELIGKTIIEELGGLDKALLEAQNAKSDLLPYMKTFILGQAILENKKLEQNAATQEAKNKYADIQIDLFDKLDNLSRDFGRAIQYLNKLYSKSALAVTRKAKKILADRNGANQIEAEQAADKIEAAIFEDDNTDSANEALQDLLNNEKEKVKELEAAYEKLKKQIANPTEPRPNNPKRDLGSSKDKKATIKRLKETKYNANRQNIIPIAPPKLMEDLNDLTLEYMEEGFYDFEDIQKKLKKDLGGLHSDYYAEAYEQSKEKAVSKGVKESEFTPTEQVNTILDKQRETSDAAKLAKASERLAKAQIEKVKQALSTDANKKSFKERLKNLIPKSGNIWLKYQESNVNSLVAKLNATASKNESPLLAEFSKLVTQNINEKLNELMPKGNNVSQEKNKSLELADIIKNEEKFAEIYEKALTKIKEQNKDNPKAISLLENLLEQNDLGKPFSKKAISNAIEQKIKQTKQSIDDVIIEGEESILAFKQKIVDSILKDAELDTEVEAEIKDRIEFEVDNLFNTQAKNHYKTTAQRIVNDAKSMADLPTTKKEAKVISQLISKVASMAKDTMINKKQVVGKTPLELMEFALKNAEIGRKIFTEAQKEVQDIIKNDENLTAQEKADLKQFLENYQKSIFDALLTNKNKDLIIKEALVKLGYATQDSKGNIVADLGKIALSKNTPKEAIEKVKEAISNELGLDPSEIDDLLAALETRFNELIQAKKEAKINAVVKANDRYKAATQFSNKARKDKIRSLIELYNAGGLTNDKILEKMARDLGIIAFTDNDQKIIEDLLQRIDNAGLGFVSAGLEEELQAYFEHIGGTFAMKEMFERWRARLLSGFITTGKNLTGFFDTGFMIGHQLIDSNMNMGLLKGNVDLNILKVIRQANRIGGTLALESLVNGSVDNGSAFAEQTGQKEGTPSVRFLEFQKYHNYWTPDLPVTVKGVTFNLNPINALKKNEKYVQRVLGATDSVNHTILQEMKSYTFIKRVVMRGSPEMSAKEAAKVAYEIMYYLDITEATIAASEMYKEQGLDIDKNKRAFNKLVYKLAQDHTLFRALRKATDEFKKSNIEYTSKSGKLKLNRRINEIAQQTRADDVIKAATEFASRYTYKQSDMGVFPLVANLIKYVKDVFPLMAARIRKNAKGTAYSKQANKIANGIEISGELLFTSTMPFINGVANILEKGLEFNPIYGGIKSATYLGLALNANNKKDTTKARELSAKSGEVIYRVAVGMLLMALLQSLADDDEADDEKAIYGQGDKNFNRNKVIETVRPQNTIRIGGRDISFDFFGTLATEIKIQSIAMDLKRYADKEITNTQYMGMVYNQIISSSFTKGLSDIATAASSTAQTGKLATYFEKKTAELSTRVVLPFTSFARQAGQVAEPEAKKAIGLKENIIKQAGVGGWLLNRPNLDYRGRTYDTGELYTSSASGAMNLFGSRVNKDPIDIWVLKAANNNLGVSDIKKDSDKFYLVDNPDGTSRPMTDEETYDVSAEAARIFNGLLVDYYNKEKNNPITKTSQEQVAKDLSERHNEAKKASFRKLFKGSKNEDKYLEDKFDWLKKDEGKETEIKRAADDIANKVSEETKALRDRLPKDKYDKQIFLAKMLRSIVNKTTTLKQWKEAGIIESVEKEGQEILKLSK
jgi:hypothetical protein